MQKVWLKDRLLKMKKQIFLLKKQTMKPKKERHVYRQKLKQKAVEDVAEIQVVVKVEKFAVV